VTGHAFKVEFAPAALRQLLRLPPGDAARLRMPILGLTEEPRPLGATKLVGTEFWRIRVGDLRVVYVVDAAARRIVVLRVARRSESTYRSLDR
jgi:mRNA interferase RelE/StbE